LFLSSVPIISFLPSWLILFFLFLFSSASCLLPAAFFRAPLRDSYLLV
jgi:hypothetical protein